MKKLLMGNEAVALGAIHAGVHVVSGYPGTPSTEVLETVAKYNTDKEIYVEWSTNEKAALEVAAGAAYAGARSMVTMKQVGLNVAADPLMSLSYVGVEGGMVILVADDPGPLSSQTEQDTRHFAKFSNLPVFDPSTPEEAYEMVGEAFELSEKVGLPVFLRPTTRVCHANSTVEVSEKRRVNRPEGFVKDSKWVIFPALSYRRHIELEQQQKEISALFDKSRFNQLSGDGTVGIAAAGVSYASVREIVDQYGLKARLLKVGNPYPIPYGLMSEFLQGLEKVIVFEELDPVIEEALAETAFLNHLEVEILGKKTGTTPYAGEFTYNVILDALNRELSFNVEPVETPEMELPSRPPVLCAGCPHRAAFYAVKQAMKGQKAVFTGDIGCYTLGNAKPLDMTDTCLCMGAGITIAQGLERVEPEVKHIAFIGDSTFFASGMTGIVNAIYNRTDITVVILDNDTTAMTGHQPHPGIGKTMMGVEHGKIDIEAVLNAFGVGWIKKVNPFDQKEAITAAKQAAEYQGVSAVIYEAPCIALHKKPAECSVTETCIGCKKCINEIGCPALYQQDGTVAVEPSLCDGCGLCMTVCPVGAITRAEVE